MDGTSEHIGVGVTLGNQRDCELKIIDDPGYQGSGSFKLNPATLSKDDIKYKNAQLANSLIERINALEVDYYPDEERAKDKLKMEEYFGFELPEVFGLNVMVRVVERDNVHFFRDKSGNFIKKDDGSKSLIELPKTTTQLDRFSSNVGWVVEMGEHACRSTKSKYYGGKYKIGDYVSFAPAAGRLMVYKGINFKIILDEHAETRVKDPQDLLIPIYT